MSSCNHNEVSEIKMPLIDILALYPFILDTAK